MENEPQNAYLPASDTEALHPFDVRAQSGRMGMIKFVAVLAFILIVVLVVMKLFASGTRDRNQLPSILADNTPYKEIPLEPGGANTPNQDKEIFEVSNENKTQPAIKTTPIAEEPLPKPRSRPVANVIIKRTETQSANNSANETAPPTSSSQTRSKPVSTSPSLLAGGYVVQVASLRSAALAEQTWEKLAVSMEDILTGSHYADIKRVDLGTRGIYYRLRVNGLADKASARKLCAQFKSRQQNCIVTKE